MNTYRFARVVAVLGAAFWLVTGVWAFFAPESFHDNVALFDPYNRHFLHDAGAFAIGLGVSLLLGLANLNALAAVLGGSAAAGVFHEISHIVDRNLGGRDSDLVGLGLIAVLFVVATVAVWPRGGGAGGNR